MKYRAVFNATIGIGWQNAIQSRPTRREIMKQDESVRGLWRRAAQIHGFPFVERSSRRVPRPGEGQLGKDQGSLLAQGASSNIDAGELKHQLVN